VGSFVWVDDYKAPPSGVADGYVIKPGDVVDVRVFEQDRMSGKGRVRSDGKVTLPFLNDVAAAGFTPFALSQQLQTRLKQFINSPVVTVSVEEAKPSPISVMGKVTRPGQFPYEAGTGVLQALALAGGPNDFARRDHIFVIRKIPEAQRIRFTYEKLLRAEGPGATFVLQEGDVVVVE
jgi:polysaccharide export outer membrane protein